MVVSLHQSTSLKILPECLKATSYHRAMPKNQITVHTDQIENFKAHKKIPTGRTLLLQKKICFIWLAHW